MPIRRIELAVNDAVTPATTEHVFQFAVEPFLMGGGARPRKHDPCGLVRAPAVLGHVRWFWRLLHANLDLKPLRQKEAALFGAGARKASSAGPAQGPASFAIQVTSSRGTKIESLPKMGEPGGYFLFAARGEPKNDVPQAEVSERVTGTARLLPVSGPIDHSVLQAFRLWSLLGGVGARTRRGIGAVQVEGGPATLKALEQVLRGLIPDPVPRGGAVRGLRAVWIGERRHASARECLDALDRWLKDYRQDRRRDAAPRPGRSHWDEPEEIRKLLAQRAPRHAPLPPTSTHPPGWARAALGLPIVFQFKDARDGDPDQTQLEGREFDRMASPLLFRPVRLTAREYAPVVALLEGPYEPPGGLELRSKTSRHLVTLTRTVDRVFDDLLPGLGGKPSGPPPLSLRRIL